MNLNDRVGDWVLLHIASPLLWKIGVGRMLVEAEAEEPYSDPFTEHRYRVIAEKGISLSGYPDYVQKGEVIIIQRDIGDILVREGSVERIPDDPVKIGGGPFNGTRWGPS